VPVWQQSATRGENGAVRRTIASRRNPPPARLAGEDALFLARSWLLSALQSSFAKQAESLTVPLDHRCRLDQHHRLQTAQPQSVEHDPEQTSIANSGARSGRWRRITCSWCAQIRCRIKNQDLQRYFESSRVGPVQLGEFTAQRLNPHRSLVPTWAIWLGY
jgi:hypothetical protein